MKKTLILGLFFVFFSVILSAQSAEKVTQMIESQEVSLSEVAYFAATYFEFSEDEASNDDALVNLERHVQFSKINDSEVSLSYDEFAYFCTQVWDIKGGVMLRLTKSPRYAFRELQSMSFIGQSIDPHEKVAGIEALTIITQCIGYSEE